MDIRKLSDTDCVKLRSGWRAEPEVFIKDVLGKGLWAKQVEVINSVRDNRRTTVKSGHSVGKMQPKSLEIDTPRGVKRWGDLRVGDEVFGLNGLSTSVVAVHENGVQAVYRVCFDDGSSTLCGLEHLWNVRGRQERRNNVAGYRTLSLGDILELGVWRKNGAGKARCWEIPVQGEVEYEESEIDLHPYFVGVWLGDGVRGLPVYCKPYLEVKERIESLGYEVRSNGDAYRVHGVSQYFKSGVFRLGSSERYIPKEYLYNSVENRKELLRGLLDTDGEVSNNGSTGYSSTSKRLIDDVIWLVRSLGGKASLQPSVKHGFYYNGNREKVECKDCYRATIILSWNPFTLKHRKDAYRLPSERNFVRWIDSIEYSHDEDCMCISVDRSDGLYLANDFIVTHNSFLSASIALWFLQCFKNSIVITTAPTQNQVEKVLWGEIRGQFKGSLIPLSGECLYTQIKVSDKHYAIGLSTDKGDRLHGFHSDYVLIIVDEASGVADEIFEAIEGMMVAENCRLLLIGNPMSAQGAFYSSFRDPSYNKITINCNDSPNVKAGKSVVPGLVSKEWIEEKKAQWGEESNLFRSRVLGEFPVEGEDVLIPMYQVLNAENRCYELKGSEPRVLGIDVARGGSNDTVFLPRVGDNVELVDGIIPVYGGGDPTQVLGMTEELIYKFEPDVVVIDDTGCGWGVSRILEKKYDFVYPFVSNGSSSDEAFLNLRAEMYWKLKEKFRKGLISIPKNTRLSEDLPTIKKEYTINGKIKIQSKHSRWDKGSGRVIKGAESKDYADCYDELTEILTNSGWKLFKDLKKKDLVYSINPETEIASFCKIKDIIVQDYKGKMKFFENRSTSFCVTPNHKMLVKRMPYYFNGKKHQYNWELSTIDNFKNNRFVMKKICKSDQHIVLGRMMFCAKDNRYNRKFEPKEYMFEENDWLEFLGWFLSEGNVLYNKKAKTYWVQISQSFTKNHEKCNIIEKMFERMGIKASKQEHGYLFGSKLLYKHLVKFGMGASNKFVPDYIKGLLPEKIEIFLNAYRLGDGYMNQGNRKFTTSSKRMADDLQELIIRCGGYATIQKRKIAGTKKYIKDHWATIRHDHYIVSQYCKAETTDSVIDKKDIKEIDYEGKIYCVTTHPYHTVLVRRNGKPFFSGNSLMMSEWGLEQCRYNEPKSTMRVMFNGGFYGGSKSKAESSRTGYG